MSNKDRHYSIIRRVHRISLTTYTRIIIREAISNGCPLTYISREIADRTYSQRSRPYYWLDTDQRSLLAWIISAIVLYIEHIVS
jgi:hypothetical protein